MILVEFLEVPLVLLRHDVAVLNETVNLVLGPYSIVRINFQSHRFGGPHAYDEFVGGDGDGHSLGVGFEHLAPLDYRRLMLGVLQHIGGDAIFLNANGVVIYDHALFDSFDTLVQCDTSFQCAVVVADFPSMASASAMVRQDSKNPQVSSSRWDHFRP